MPVEQAEGGGNATTVDHPRDNNDLPLRSGKENNTCTSSEDIKQLLTNRENLEKELQQSRRRVKRNEDTIRSLTRQILQNVRHVLNAEEEARDERYNEVGQLKGYIAEIEQESKDLNCSLEEAKDLNDRYVAEYENLSTYVEVVEQENHDLHNDLMDTRDHLDQREAENEALCNTVVTLLFEIRRLQATQPGLFRRLRDATD
ncbi:uncharacterized protein PG986_005045 [Apiospora aurea]|uniref:Uncharacterized protein n=1 Tax=Apiospora aurea TaxID=335848 RepID=A0ABR1QGE5_9PEZI